MIDDAAMDDYRKAFDTVHPLRLEAKPIPTGSSPGCPASARSPAPSSASCRFLLRHRSPEEGAANQRTS